jgi:NADH dehydrogenase
VRTPVTTRILVVGGGYVGLYSALGLERHLTTAEATLVSPESFMVYQPFLPEAASGTIEPRHVVIPLRDLLRKTRVIVGRLEGLGHDDRVARVVLPSGEPQTLAYDHIVLGLGLVGG